MKYKEALIGLVIMMIVSIVALLISIKLDIKYDLGNSEGLIIEYNMTNMGIKRITDVTDYNIAIYEDKVKITLDIHGDFDIDKERTISINKEQVEQIKNSIQDNKLLNLSEKDSKGCDGYYTTMTIYTKDKKQKIGGYLYSNERYEKVAEIITDTVRNELSSFIEETQLLVDKAIGER